MAHFAELDTNNKVIRVIVVDNNVINNLPFPESEPLGIEFCKFTYGENTIWKQTSYNNSFRKRYASIGLIYNFDIDAFISEKPFPSWTLNVETGLWEAPTPIPNPNTPLKFYWDEDTLSWVKKSSF